MNKAITFDIFYDRAKKMHGDKFNYFQETYVSLSKKIKMKCNSCSFIFEQSAEAHVYGNGCPKCSGKYANINTFINKSNLKHNNKYDYSLVNYVNNSTKVKIICKEHGIFEQQPNNHLNGQGCINCIKLIIKSKDDFIKNTKKYEKEYDYSLVNYVNNKTKIKIICKKCNKINFQFPLNHLRGAGCRSCAIKNVVKNITKSKEKFIKDAEKIHKNRYDYNQSDYKSSNVKVKIFCKKCNKYFYQLPSNHLTGKGCSSCSKSISKPEIQWLDSLGIKKEYRQKEIKCGNSKYIVDALDIENKIIYEFYGDFWHGNPNKYNLNDINKKTGSTFEELYNKTVKKEELLKKNGYKIISIWESDWKKNNE